MTRVRAPWQERQRSTHDIEEMAKMRSEGATYQQIGEVFGLHHSTVMHHLSTLYPVPHNGWNWAMTPHEIRTAQVMRGNGASFLEIGRALHHGTNTVRSTLQSLKAQSDVARWFHQHPPSSTA